MATSGKLPSAWGAAGQVTSSAHVCQGLLGWTVTVSGGDFLTSSLEGSVRNHKIWGWHSISQIWELEVFPQKQLCSLSCAIFAS